MDKPMFTFHDILTGIETQRKMTEDEIAALVEPISEDAPTSN